MDEGESPAIFLDPGRELTGRFQVHFRIANLAEQTPRIRRVVLVSFEMPRAVRLQSCVCEDFRTVGPWLWRRVADGVASGLIQESNEYRVNCVP